MPNFVFNYEIFAAMLFFMVMDHNILAYVLQHKHTNKMQSNMFCYWCAYVQVYFKCFGEFSSTLDLSVYLKKADIELIDGDFSGHLLYYLLINLRKKL